MCAHAAGQDREKGWGGHGRDGVVWGVGSCITRTRLVFQNKICRYFLFNLYAILGAMDAIVHILDVFVGSGNPPEHQPDRTKGTQGATRAK